MFRKLFLRIKRFLFKRITGLNHDDVYKLQYVQKYLEHNQRCKYKTYNDYLKEHFNKIGVDNNAK